MIPRLLTVTLLVSAAVLVRSFANTRTQDIGFGRKQLLLVWLAADAKPAEAKPDKK